MALDQAETFEWLRNRVQELETELKSTAAERDAELARLQRTMKFWEESYLAEHEVWGNCKWKAQVESTSTSAREAERERDVSLCGPHRKEYTKFIVGGCVACWLDSAREAERAMIRNAVKRRRDYFAARDVHNGWSGNESGPCCEQCAMRPEHFTGHADALKSLVGCRNPFQLPEVCQCHVAVREAVTSGIVEAHDQLLRSSWLTAIAADQREAGEPVGEKDA